MFKMLRIEISNMTSFFTPSGVKFKIFMWHELKVDLEKYEKAFPLEIIFISISTFYTQRKLGIREERYLAVNSQLSWNRR